MGTVWRPFSARWVEDGPKAVVEVCDEGQWVAVAWFDSPQDAALCAETLRRGREPCEE